VDNLPRSCGLPVEKYRKRELKVLQSANPSNRQHDAPRPESPTLAHSRSQCLTPSPTTRYAPTKKLDPFPLPCYSCVRRQQQSGLLTAPTSLSNRTLFESCSLGSSERVGRLRGNWPQSIRPGPGTPVHRAVWHG
jgi:hypothetical protein